MATLWSIVTTLAMMISAGSYVFAIHPPESGGGALRRGAGAVMVGSGLLTVLGLRLAAGAP